MGREWLFRFNEAPAIFLPSKCVLDGSYIGIVGSTHSSRISSFLTLVRLFLSPSLDPFHFRCSGCFLHVAEKFFHGHVQIHISGM